MEDEFVGFVVQSKERTTGEEQQWDICPTLTSDTNVVTVSPDVPSQVEDVITRSYGVSRPMVK